ncbi:MAG: hypothetical protein ACJ8AW_05065 [Rhodopila sp.]
MNLVIAQMLVLSPLPNSLPGSRLVNWAAAASGMAMMRRIKFLQVLGVALIWSAIAATPRETLPEFSGAGSMISIIVAEGGKLQGL